jgi:hypothetical protein
MKYLSSKFHYPLSLLTTVSLCTFKRDLLNKATTIQPSPLMYRDEVFGESLELMGRLRDGAVERH